MPIDEKLLTLTQWLSPSFPIGAFAYSHGLEQAIHDGWVGDAQELEDWLRACLTSGAARTDAIWLRLAFAADDPVEIDTLARAFAASGERLHEAERQGAAFVQTTNAVWDLDIPEVLLPVAVGCATARAKLDEDTAALLYLQAFVNNLVSAAMRLMPLGQIAGQQVQSTLQSTCVAVAEDTQDATVDDVYSNTFMSDIASMRHETLQPRMFQT